jgi:uncharacterized coiled-coil DUF342 family protein
MAFRTQNWHFTINNPTLEDHQGITNARRTLNSVNYVGYCLEASLVQGFVYNHAGVSEKVMVKLLPRATWQPVDGKFRDNDLYCAKRSSGLLVDIGTIPAHGVFKKRKIEGTKKIEVESTLVYDLEKQLASCREHAEEERAEADELKQQLATSRHEAKGESDALKKQLATSRHEAKEESDALKKQLATSRHEAKEESDALKKQLGSCREHAQEARAEMDELKKQLDLMNAEEEKEETDELKKQLVSCRQEVDELTAELNITAFTMINGLKNSFDEDTKRKQYNLKNISKSLARIYGWYCSYNKDAKLAIDQACNDIERVGKALKTAKLHYHPDKAVNGGLWCKIISGEIIKFLNHLQEQYDEKKNDWY